MNVYTHLFRPLLFRLDPETVHHLTIEACRLAGWLPGVPQLTHACLGIAAPQLEIEVAGLHFPNPIGLAAGWDKSGRALRLLEQLGFGFTEIGSISARSSQGNPKPRLFRLPQDQAIVVNYGLPNDGAAIVAKRLSTFRARRPLGVNVVKTNDGPESARCGDDQILDDYEKSVSLTHRLASYLTLNLSCPNAKDGKDFFAKSGTITRLLERLASLQVDCPVFLKVPPTPQPASLERLIAEVESFAFVRGFIFNLPSGKPDSLRLRTSRSQLAEMPGAVAGKPVEQLINSCIRELYQRMPRDRFAIIGAGGVFSADDAYQKFRCGASLVQVYSAMIYEGPGIAKRINQGLLTRLERDGFQNISEAIGTGVK